ncbi:hypothetical protein TNCV_4933251 [Trichonephila clavipes]|nr:hypothetical protein TNCV_4933251 [Trichonephila clavipes]
MEYNRNMWRDGQVCPDVGQETRERSPALDGEKEKRPCPGSRKHERRALVGTDWKRALKKGLGLRLE